MLHEPCRYTLTTAAMSSLDDCLSSTSCSSSPKVDELGLPVVAHPFDDPKADTILRTSDDANFYVHRLLLSLASPVFETMFIPQGTDPTAIEGMNVNETDSEGRPIIPVAEKASALHLLLTWLDPRCIPLRNTLDDLHLAVELADKYDMDCVIKHVQTILKEARRFVDTEPIRVFAIGIRCRDQELVTLAAKETLRFTLEEGLEAYAPELKSVSGANVQRLYKYHVACGKAAENVAKNFCWATKHAFVWKGQSSHPTPCNETREHGVYWTHWWMKYMKLAQAELYNRPRGLAVFKPEFAEIFLDEGRQCRTCKPKMHEDFQRFSKIFAEEVEKAVTQVRVAWISSLC